MSRLDRRLEVFRRDDVADGLLRAVQPFVNMTDAIERSGHEILDAPTTVLETVKDQVEQEIRQQDPEQFMQNLRAAYRTVITAVGEDEFVDLFEHALRAGMSVLKDAAKRDRRYSLLLRLAARADEVVPCAGVIAFSLAGGAEELNRGLLDSAGAVHRVSEMPSGERRARDLKAALHEVLETTYEPYLKAIVVLCGFIEDRWAEPVDGKLGVLCNQAAAAVARIDRETYGGLVDEDAGWLRNATSHKSHEYWRYDHRRDVLIVRDANRAPTEFAVEDLIVRTARLWSLSGPTFANVSMLYMMRNFWLGTGLARRMLVALKHDVMGEPEAAAAAMAEYTAHGNTLFEPVLRWADARRPRRRPADAAPNADEAATGKGA